MVLSVDKQTKSTPTARTTIMSLKVEQPSPTKRSSSLLVDYSKRKANVTLPLKKELFGGASSVRRRSSSLNRRSAVDTIEDALALADSSSSSSLHKKPQRSSCCEHESSTSTETTDNTNDESFSILSPENDDVNDNNTDVQQQIDRQVSFRVRKKSIRRTKSMDERKMSSYDALQNSIRSELLMQDAEDQEGDQPDDDDDDVSIATNTTSKRSSMPATVSVDRRAQLANARKKHQSMRNLTKQQQSTSMRNLMASATAACAPASTAPKLSPTPSIPRPTKKKSDSLSLSKSLHDPTSSPTPRSSLRRASLLSSKQKCRSCRNVMRRTKSLQEGKAPTLNLSNSLHGSSNHTTTVSSLSSPCSSPTQKSPSSKSRVRRSSTLGGTIPSASAHGRRGSMLSVMRSQTMSKRNLLESSLSTSTMMSAAMNDESSVMNDDSTIFMAANAGRSRIRRLTDAL